MDKYLKGIRKNPRELAEGQRDGKAKKRTVVE